MNNYFQDKTVIVTGASKGVGAATARIFANARANLVIVARNSTALKAISDELQVKTRVMPVAMDVSNYSECENLISQSIIEFSSIHFLINNAGCHKRGLVEDVDPIDHGEMIDVNLKAPIILSRMVIPHMRKSGGGAIINVSSLAGRTPVPGSASYSASKSGLRAFTYSLASELKNSQIKLGVISPGPINTGFIMSNIDAVSDITFSQPISTPNKVAKEILKLCVNKRQEKSIPMISGFLTTITYLFPRFSSFLQPLLEAKGRRVKEKLKIRNKNISL